MSIAFNGRKDVTEIINKLQSTNNKLERIIEQLPTSDDKMLAELDILLNMQLKLMHTNTTKERGTLFLEQATGKARSLRERFNVIKNNGRLRKRV